MTHASVFWINDRLTGIINIEDIPAEDRYREAVSRVRFTDGKYYPARIIALSDNMKELENSEDQFMSQLKQSEAKSLPKTRKNKGQHSKNLVNTAATEKQVSLALGERPRLDNKLSAAKEKTANANKVLKKKQKEADREMELALLNIKTSLFSDNFEASRNSDNIEQKNISEAATNTNKTLFNRRINKYQITDIVSTKSGIANKIQSVSRKRTLPYSNDMEETNLENFESERNSETEVHSPKNESGMKTEEDIDESDHGSCDLNKTKKSFNSMKNMCSSCAALKRHNNSSIKEFMWDLGAFLEMDLKSSLPRKSVASKTDDILPILPVAENQKKVEISLGSGLWISKAAKSKILITCDNDPYKLTRQVIQELYGKDTLRNPDITAMGQGAGGRGIGIENLQAIYKFVKRNTPWDCPPLTKNNKQRPKLTFTLFTREVNRKIISLRRTTANLFDSEEETPQGVPDTPLLKSVKKKGAKRSVCQEPTTLDISPPCSTSKKRCPPRTSTESNSRTPVKNTTPKKTPKKTPTTTPQKSPKNVWVVTPLKQNNTENIQTPEPEDASLGSHQNAPVQNLSKDSVAPASTQFYPYYSYQPNVNNPHQYSHAMHSYPYPQQSMMIPQSYPTEQHPPYNYPPPQQHYQFNPADSPNQAYSQQYPTNSSNSAYQHEKENLASSYTQL